LAQVEKDTSDAQRLVAEKIQSRLSDELKGFQNN
jgi:hypothetical protein